MSKINSEIMNNSILIITAQCWKCSEKMLVALSGSDTSFEHGPADFSKEEIAAAITGGVFLEYVSSKTAEKTYLANVCKECGEFVGEFYLFADCWAEAMYGRLEYIRINV